MKRSEPSIEYGNGEVSKSLSKDNMHSSGATAPLSVGRAQWHVENYKLHLKSSLLLTCCTVHKYSHITVHNASALL